MSKQEGKRSVPFRATRDHHSSEAAEDYVELVFDLIESEGQARTCTIADHLGVSHVTALRTIRRLQAEGYLDTAPHKPVTLTKEGRKLAEYARYRHTVLLAFFSRLGVPDTQAEIDVEGVEHHISDVTLECIERFLAKKEK